MTDFAASPNVSALSLLNAEVAAKVYRPITQGGIRVIRLHAAANKNDPLSCTIVSVSLSAAPHYEALSYVWGSQDTPDHILLEGEQFYVTRNLHEALFHLRQVDGDRLLWVDALAINQLDIEERNSQVHLMPQIYSRAERTLAWLGAGDPSVTALFKTLELTDDDPAHSGMFEEKKGRDLQKLIDDTFPIATISYWGRVWVVQELAHSGTVFFLYGTEAVTLQAISSYFQRLQRILFVGGKQLARLKASTYLTGFRIVRDFVPLFTSETGFALNLDLVSWLLYHCRARFCADPRDKIFGFYNYLNAATTSLITPLMAIAGHL